MAQSPIGVGIGPHANSHTGSNADRAISVQSDIGAGSSTGSDACAGVDAHAVV